MLMLKGLVRSLFQIGLFAAVLPFPPLWLSAAGAVVGLIGYAEYMTQVPYRLVPLAW